MIEEIWVGIKPYEKHLQVSNLGNVKRLPSNTLKWNYSKLGKPFLHNTRVTEKILKQSILRTGYKNVRSQVEGERVNIITHIEVAKAFVPNPENKPCVNHKDADKTNNNSENLEWATYEENSTHYHENKTHDTFGSIAKAFTGSVDAYNYQTDEFVCRMFGNKDMKSKGFDFRLVSAVLKGKRNSHNNCYFVKNENEIVKVESTEQFSKLTFKPLDVFDKKGKLVFTLQEYEDIISHKLTPQRVSDCLMGRAKQHKGLIFKLREQ